MKPVPSRLVCCHQALATARPFTVLLFGSLLVQPLIAGMAAIVLFRNTHGVDFIPGWYQVGFEYDGWVLELHPGYKYQGIVWYLMPPLRGVQHSRRWGSFRWDSARADQSPTQGRYALVLTGVGSNTFVAIGDGTGAGFLFKGFLGVGQEARGTFFVGQKPRLVLRRVGSEVQLLWPTNLTGFRLETSAGLAAHDAWLTVTNQTAIVGEDFAVTLDAAAGTGFYRLRK